MADQPSQNLGKLSYPIIYESSRGHLDDSKMRRIPLEVMFPEDGLLHQYLTSSVHCNPEIMDFSAPKRRSVAQAIVRYSEYSKAKTDDLFLRKRYLRGALYNGKQGVRR